MNTQSTQNKVEFSKSLKQQPKPNNVFDVATTLKDFFKWWCVFLRPFVKLTDREIDVISSFLRERYELSKVISDPTVLDAQLMGPDTKNKVIKECNITLQHFYVVMSNLRKNNVITDTGINRRLIPNIRKNDDGTFRILIRFIEKKDAI